MRTPSVHINNAAVQQDGIAGELCLMFHTLKLTVMAYFFNAVFRKKPGTQEGKWYASLVSKMKMTEEELAQEIGDMTSLSPVDVMAVLKALLYLIPKFLRMGIRIQLGDLGSFRITGSSNGVENKEDVDAHCIKKTRPCFTCGAALRNAVKDLHFERQEPNKQSPNP